MLMHPVAGCDRFRRKADGLAVFPYPRGTRSRAVTPAASAPGVIWSTATTTLSSGDSRMVLGVVIQNA
jgi:hypothetical protein